MEASEKRKHSEFREQLEEEEEEEGVSSQRVIDGESSPRGKKGESSRSVKDAQSRQCTEQERAVEKRMYSGSYLRVKEENESSQHAMDCDSSQHVQEGESRQYSKDGQSTQRVKEGRGGRASGRGQSSSAHRHLPQGGCHASHARRNQRPTRTTSGMVQLQVRGGGHRHVEIHSQEDGLSQVGSGI